ncbi:MAG: peptide ABC transporter permease [Verrucomicrobiales bacterium]|nr:peptide ABC transporter permease [Verrucomicrobiales bacterium]
MSTAETNLQYEEGASLWTDAWRRLAQNRMAVIATVIFGLIILLCLIGPLLFGQHSGETNNLENAFQKPSGSHWFGTDDLGRDVFVRTLEGGRISLAVGFLATAVSLVIGVVYGSFAGYVGGRTDAFLMRIVDILYSLPFTIFVILLMVMFGRNFILLFVAIGFVEWLTMARIVRAQIMALKDTEFVEAARALGYGNLRIIFGHLLPNILGPVIIYASLTVPAVMLLEAVLSFLGLGVQPPMSSWGLLIKDGAEKIDVYPWLLIFPALFFSATLFSLNFIGDGLRDALDPKSSKD